MQWTRSKTIVLVAAGLFGLAALVLAVSFARAWSIKTLHGNTPPARQAVESLFGQALPRGAEVLFIALQPGQDGGVFAARILLHDEASGSIVHPDPKLFSEGLSKPFERFCPEGIDSVLKPDQFAESKGWTAINGYGCLVYAQDQQKRHNLIIIVGATHEYRLPRAVYSAFSE